MKKKGESGSEERRKWITVIKGSNPSLLTSHSLTHSLPHARNSSVHYTKVGGEAIWPGGGDAASS